MLGCYLTSDDDAFLDILTDELTKFNLSNDDSSSILLFPPFSSRNRFLLHRLRDSNFPNLSSFSIGGGEKSIRRTIVCSKSQLMEETTVTTTSTIDPTKRRPDQALYKAPRRSKNAETPPPPVEETPPPDSPAKTKQTARPSATLYVPPSRRSQPSAPSSTKENENEEEDEWDKKFDDNGNSLKDDPVEEIRTKFKDAVQIKNPINDYAQWSLDDMQIKEGDLAHIIEVSNFPAHFRTEDLSTAFKSHNRSGFDIKWVDDTHALIVFPDANMALDALQMEHPLLKSSAMSQASTASKKKAKSSAEFLQPYKLRPQTSSLTANRRICAALGVKNPMSTDKTQSERKKIESARQQKIRDKEEQKAVWDGEVLSASPTT